MLDVTESAFKAAELATSHAGGRRTQAEQSHASSSHQAVSHQSTFDAIYREHPKAPRPPDLSFAKWIETNGHHKSFAMDFESNGFMPRARATEFALTPLSVEHGPVGETFSWIIDPKANIPDELSLKNIHHITNEFIRKAAAAGIAKPFEQHAREIMRAVAGKTLVAHNAEGLDHPLFQKELSLLPTPTSLEGLQTTMVCSMKIAKGLLPENVSVSQDNLADIYDVDRSSRATGHGAAKDAIILAHIVREMNTDYLKHVRRYRQGIGEAERIFQTGAKLPVVRGVRKASPSPKTAGTGTVTPAAGDRSKNISGLETPKFARNPSPQIGRRGSTPEPLPSALMTHYYKPRGDSPEVSPIAAMPHLPAHVDMSSGPVRVRFDTPPAAAEVNLKMPEEPTAHVRSTAVQSLPHTQPSSARGTPNTASPPVASSPTRRELPEAPVQLPHSLEARIAEMFQQQMQHFLTQNAGAVVRQTAQTEPQSGQKRTRWEEKLANAERPQKREGGFNPAWSERPQARKWTDYKEFPSMKNRGKHIDDVSTQTLRWYIENINDLHPVTKGFFNEAIAWRGRSVSPDRASAEAKAGRRATGAARQDASATAPNRRVSPRQLSDEPAASGHGGPSHSREISFAGFATRSPAADGIPPVPKRPRIDKEDPNYSPSRSDASDSGSSSDPDSLSVSG